MCVCVNVHACMHTHTHTHTHTHLRLHTRTIKLTHTNTHKVTLAWHQFSLYLIQEDWKKGICAGRLRLWKESEGGMKWGGGKGSGCVCGGERLCVCERETARACEKERERQASESRGCTRLGIYEYTHSLMIAAMSRQRLVRG